MRIPYRKPGPYSQIKSDPCITKAKFSELQKKLDKLTNISRPQAAAEVMRLAAMGDFSENAAYQMAKGRLRGINHNILTIEHQLNHADIINSDQQTDIVELGHTVTVETVNGQKTYKILGSMETNPEKGIISHNSPIGSALLGHRVGEVIKVKLADKEVAYKITNIDFS